MARTLTDEQLESTIPPETLITKDDICAIAEVRPKTFEAWMVKFPDFPEGQYQTGGDGERIGTEKWYRIGEFIAWACRHGRLDCGDRDEAEGWVDQEQLAAALGVAPITIRVWQGKGRFPRPDERRAKTPFWCAATLEAWRLGTLAAQAGVPSPDLEAGDPLAAAR